MRSLFALLVPLALGASVLGGTTIVAQPAGHVVEIVGEDYRPFDLTIAAGDTVTWVNDGGGAHNVRSVDDLFRSPFLLGGASFSYTFAAAGDFEYRCSIHPFMVGTIRVRAAGGPATPTPILPTPDPTASPTRPPRPDITIVARIFVPAVARGD